MLPDHEILDVTIENLEELNLFCKKSKRDTLGYQQKLEWYKDRLEEGLRYKLLMVNERGKMVSRGMIEYLPGEKAWRAMNADGYMVIHCIWVVGRAKKKGYGRELLDICLADARDEGMNGVAMLTSSKPWLAGSKLFLHSGFEKIEEFPPFELLAKRFREAPAPSFPDNWEERARSYGEGLTVIRGDQCPFIEDASELVREFAEERSVPFKVIDLKSASEVQERSPSPYGVFNMVYNGGLIAYHYILKKDLSKLLEE